MKPTKIIDCVNTAKYFHEFIYLRAHWQVFSIMSFLKKAKNNEKGYFQLHLTSLINSVKSLDTLKELAQIPLTSL